jgi:ketosteroid isomerase-like protein
MEYVNPPDAVESGTRVGREHIASVRDVYPDFHAEPERFIDAGDEVVVIASVRARTARSDVELRWRQGFVWTIRDGKAVRFQWFNDPKEALAAAGMPEEEG